MSKIVVSVFITVYNHDKYICRALDSVVMQRTDFPVEILVGEDCSTDNSRQVLRQWEMENPGKATVYYREHNLNATDCPNSWDLRLRCKGKYLICLEGDDFWTDPDKLQKQVDFLESHPQYLAVAHNCVVVGADSLPNGESYPQCTDPEYSMRHFASDLLPGQYTTVMTRNYMEMADFDTSLLLRRFGPGDRRLYFTLLCHGRIACLQETMSAYRHITSGGSSFSATNRYRYEREEAYCRALMEYAAAHGHQEALRCSEMLYLRNIRYALRKKLVSAEQAKQDRKRIAHPLRAAMLLLKRDINYRIFHKTLHI